MYLFGLVGVKMHKPQTLTKRGLQGSTTTAATYSYYCRVIDSANLKNPFFVQLCCMKHNEKRDKAKSLYLTGRYNQKEIAEIVGISEKTLSKWVNDPEDKWDDLKTSLLTTRNNELGRLYKMLKVMNNSLDEKSESKTPINSKDADAVLKLTQAIKNLEIETSIAEKVDVGTEFINMISKEDTEFAKQVSKWFDIYLNQFA